MAHHQATYSRDKRRGGWIVRVVGPHAAKFAGREIPVRLRSGEERSTLLGRLLWSGSDQGGSPVALYEMRAMPEADSDIPF
jgi:hypothetical protein